MNVIQIFHYTEDGITQRYECAATDVQVEIFDVVCDGGKPKAIGSRWVHMVDQITNATRLIKAARDANAVKTVMLVYEEFAHRAAKMSTTVTSSYASFGACRREADQFAADFLASLQAADDLAAGHPPQRASRPHSRALVTASA